MLLLLVLSLYSPAHAALRGRLQAEPAEGQSELGSIITNLLSDSEVLRRAKTPRQIGESVLGWTRKMLAATVLLLHPLTCNYAFRLCLLLGRRHAAQNAICRPQW